jgi:hypothetical protein
VRCGAIRNFKNKRGEFLKGKINELETNSENRIEAYINLK